ncbi:unnamed protein product [Ranitomeya imitator]|uniref:C2H2-type domain-containing protein n=1 Tax=Ranitomeya imitator TaxID=111125 RepID=A0ABN9KR00_9NEOB|nr:unnamed protein product [Ranitomeya imitator]
MMLPTVETGIRPYKCDVCNKAFTQRCSLESHLKKIHGVQQGYAYKQRRDKLFVCEECGYTGPSQEDLYLHVYNLHPGSAFLKKTTKKLNALLQNKIASVLHGSPKPEEEVDMHYCTSGVMVYRFKRYRRDGLAQVKRARSDMAAAEAARTAYGRIGIPRRGPWSHWETLRKPANPRIRYPYFESVRVSEVSRSVKALQTADTDARSRDRSSPSVASQRDSSESEEDSDTARCSDNSSEVEDAFPAEATDKLIKAVRSTMGLVDEK